MSEPHAMSPLGYGPSANDPETGELIQANAFVYGAGVETLSAFARDMISLLNGDIDSADISSSEVVRSWVERQRAPGSRETGRPADDHHTSIDGFSVDRVDAAMDFSRANAISAAAGGSAGAPASIPEALARFEQSRDRLRRGGAFGQGEELGSARLQNLVGTDIEQMMSGPEMQLMAGLDPFMPLDARSVAAASPFQGMSVSRMAALERARARIAQESHCLLRADFADDGLLGLAREIQRAVSSGDGTLDWYGQTYTLRAPDGSIDQEAVRLMIRHPIFDGVTAHETGHTVGLRHNFSGSYDSLNYHARYWELRDDGSMQPRAWDPLTDAEIDGRIREYQYSTVMDYGNNFVVTDAAGLGHYDYAAIKMGYGDMVEVFSNAADPSTINWIHFITKLGWPVPFRLEAFTGGAPAAYQYTEMPGILGGRERLEERADVPYTSLRADPFLAGGGIFDELQDANGRPSVPYLFCSDEQADLGPDCLRYDAGADPYETITSVADQYWNYYIFNAFRRGRLGFDPWSYANRVHSRYMSKLQYTNQIYALYRPIFDDMFGGTPGFDTFFTRPDGMGAYTAAVGVGFETFTQVITTPEPGEYVTMTRPDGSTGMTQGGDFGVTPDASIDAFEGRGLETTWDFDAGYYWFDQLDRAGYYYDKVLAIMVLTDPETHFLGRDTAADVRRYQISYYSSFPGAMESLFGGLLGEDWDAVAPRVDGTGLVYPDPLDLVSGGMPGVPVDPNASFSIQLFASVYGMALIPETFDRTYMNKSRIWVRGGAEGVEIDPRWPIVEFMDVTSGLTYVAASYLDAAGVETGPGAR
ncbi:MAG: zinc-dependent metalloprotease, partial [Myxococcales bacterium]|nr:zinc-dependent metalloprotease [Myxococcales bacterium]